MLHLANGREVVSFLIFLSLAIPMPHILKILFVLHLATDLHPCTTGEVSTGEASPSTVRKRSQSLINVCLAVVFGDSTAQVAHELHLTQKRDRENILDEIQVPVQSSHESRVEHPMVQTEAYCN